MGTVYTTLFQTNKSTINDAKDKLTEGIKAYEHLIGLIDSNKSSINQRNRRVTHSGGTRRRKSKKSQRGKSKKSQRR